MNKIIKVLRWPEDKFRGIVPWYVIAWRILWAPFIITFVVLSGISIGISYGPKIGLRFIKDSL